MLNFKLRTIASRLVMIAALLGASTPALAQQSQPQRTWRVTTMEHVDLWLHGFAMLTSDTGHVPFFAPNYKRDIKAIKAQKNIFSQLDANQAQLSQRFATNPALTNAQFLAMYFPSFQELVTATDRFIRANGDPRAASDQQMAEEFQILAANFQSPADRDWLRLFVSSLQDENNRFYQAYWNNEQQVRNAAFAQVNQLWASQWYPKLSRYLNNTQQSRGEMLLSLPLGGEGRTVNGGKSDNLIAVGFPRTADSANEALFAFVHEAVAKLVDESINDNTTPAEKRSGATIGYEGNGAVRGGEMLLEHVAPDLVPNYMRYYLGQLGKPAPAGDPRAAFEAAFPLPQAILTALKQAIDTTLAGI